MKLGNWDHLNKKRCHFTIVGIPVIKIKQSYNHMLWNKHHYPWKVCLYIETMPCCSSYWILKLAIKYPSWHSVSAVLRDRIAALASLAAVYSAKQWLPSRRSTGGTITASHYTAITWGISNQWQLDCLFNSLFTLTSEETSMVRITGPW